MSHLENVSEEEINRLLGMVVDVENLFMSVHKEEDTDTKQVYFYLFKVRPSLLTSWDFFFLIWGCDVSHQPRFDPINPPCSHALPAAPRWVLLARGFPGCVKQVMRSHGLFCSSSGSASCR